jgi:oxygen-independent coproporphyrinogen III oxidase
MELRNWLRNQFNAKMFGKEQLALQNQAFALESHFEAIESLGLYLHIPFCRQICPYCPYNKELYYAAVATRYAKAVMEEVSRYRDIVGKRPITSFYIGGGTPTTMLHNGLDQILDQIHDTFNMQCDIHMESHPLDLTVENLREIRSMGVHHLSMGIEALQDRHLRTLCRPYTVAQAKHAMVQAMDSGFQSVNVDLMFALPDQTHNELREAGDTLVQLGVDQVAAYPLFTFPYTKWPRLQHMRHDQRYNLWQKRRMFQILEDIFYDAGYERTSVWAFTRAGVPRYCSVTVPLYLGLGASGSSYLRDVFYLNTFNVNAYIQALENGQTPIALSLALTPRMQMAGWLYWRIYETRFKKNDFYRRFGQDFDAVYGGCFSFLSHLGLLTDREDDIVLTDGGAYWLHALQDLFSIDYVSQLWGTAQETPWPRKVLL